MDYSLPQIVQCRTPVLWSRDDRPLPIQLDKPILLADQRTARHLLARIVTFDDRTRTFNESADSVVIPEDYEGKRLVTTCPGLYTNLWMRSAHFLRVKKVRAK